MSRSTLARRLESARERRGLNKTEAARLHDVSVATICCWESGLHIPRKVEDVVRRYGLRMEEFWGDDFLEEAAS